MVSLLTVGGLAMTRVSWVAAVLLLGGAARAAPEALLFADDFSVATAPGDGLGPSWNLRGLWHADGRANSDLAGGANQALENQATCADCRVEAQVQAGPASEAGLSLRASTPDDRYDAVLLDTGNVRLRRVSQGVATTLAEAAGAIDPAAPFTLSLQAAGAQLTVAVDGAALISLADPAPLLAPGAAGLWATGAGAAFGAFRLSGPQAATGDDWPFYRRDFAGSGASSGALTLADARGLRLAFTASIAGGSDANPVVSGGTVYIAGGYGNLLALDAATGAVQWSQPIGLSSKGPCAPYQQGPIGAAAVAGQSVFAAGGDGRIYAFDKDSGAPLWVTPIADTLANDFVWSSVFPVNGALYLGVATLGESKCGENPGRVVSLDQATGAVLGTWWADEAQGKGGGVWTSPAWDPLSGRLFVTTGTVADGVKDPSTKPWQQAFVAIDPATMQTLDSFQPVKTDFFTDWDFGASPTLVDSGGLGLVIAANKNGIVYALDRNNLAAGPLWTYVISGPGASPDLGESTIVSAAWANGRVFVGGGRSADGAFPGSVAALDPATGAPSWLMHPDGFVLPGLAAAGDVVFALSSHAADRTGTIYALDQATGEVVFTLPTAGRLFAQPTFANGVLYVVDDAGTLYALKP